MKLNNSLKKTFNLSLAGIIGLQTTAFSAGNYWDDILDNSLMNVTPGGVIFEKDSSGNVMNTTFHTGSFSFRFGGAFNYPEPIINLSAPKLSAGCGGLSVKGMFASVIGLDRFEEMLKNAGASLAWGIAVGLIYSLPGIGAAFRMIESWASKIQQLLANACQSGMAIGRMISEESGFKDNALSKTIVDADKTVAKLDGMVKDKLEQHGISKYFDDKMVFSGSSASSGSAPTQEDINDRWREFLISGILYYSVSTNALMSYLKMLTITEFDNWQKIITGKNYNDSGLSFKHFKFFITLDNKPASSTEKIFSLDDLFSASSSAATLSITDKETLSRLFVASAIIRYSGRDLITANNQNLKSILDKVSCIGNTGMTADQKKACEADLVPIVQGDNNSIQKAVFDTQGTDTQKLATDLVNYLYFGNTQGEGPTVNKTVDATTGAITETITAGAGTRDLPINALGFNMVVLPSGSEDNQANSKIYVFYPTAKKDNDSLKFYKFTSNEEGAKVRSLNIMKKIIRNGDFSTINTDIPFLVPGIIDKMKIIQQSLPNEQDSLIDLLANYNAFHIVRTSIINLIESNAIRETLLPALIVKTGVGIKLLEKDLKLDKTSRDAWSSLSISNEAVLNVLSKKAYDHLKENHDKELISPEGLNQLFKNQDMANRSRQLIITPKAPGGY